MAGADRGMIARFDKDNCALGDTLILYASEKTNVTVPSAIMEMPVTTVGSGAIVAPKARQIRIAEGYTAIHSKALNYLGSAMESLMLPTTLRAVDAPESTPPIYYKSLGKVFMDRVLPQDEYTQLSHGSRHLGDSVCLPMAPEDGDSVQLMSDVLDCLGYRMMRMSDYRLPLYYMSNLRKGGDTIFEKLIRLDEDGLREESEFDGVLRRIQRGQLDERRDRFSELWNDREVMLNHDIIKCIERDRALVLFREGEPQGSGMRFRMQALTGIFFYPLLHRVRLLGEDYFVYSRAYPGDFKAGHKYIRQNVCVFDRQGLVTDPTRAEEVYEKYRLLVML